MYESKPTEREGERIDTIVTEAITATASTGGNGRRGGAKGPGVEQYKKALGIVGGVAAAEAVAILLMVVF